MRYVLLSMMLAGASLAQQPRPRAGGWMSEQRLTNQLNLDAVQQNKVHAAMEEARVAQQGLDQKVFDLRSQLAAAIKSGSEPNIDRVAQDMASVQQQQTAIHAKALAKIYGSLDAQQQARFERIMSRDLGTPGLRRQPRQR